MTSGTREAVMHPDDECRPVAWQPSNAFSELMGSPVTPTPPPLQPGDAVWVLAVVDSVQSSGPNDPHPGYWLNFEAAGDDMLYFGPQSIDKYKPFRRIEGEVKP